MKKITDTQKYAILWLNYNKYSSLDIAKTLKINEQQIIEIIGSNTSTQPQTNIMKNLMVTESVGQRHQVAVMTKAASEIADSERQKLTVNNTKNKESFIFKPTGH